MKKITIKNLSDLKTFAKEFALTLRGGDVVGLVGDLGAGKTTLVQLLARELGVKRAVKSPTFIIMQTFEVGAAARKRGIRHLCHVDAYRLEDAEDLHDRGVDEYLGKTDTVALVEWAERIPSLHARPGYQKLTFVFGRGEERVITIQR